MLSSLKNIKIGKQIIEHTVLLAEINTCTSARAELRSPTLILTLSAAALKRFYQLRMALNMLRRR